MVDEAPQIPDSIDRASRGLSHFLQSLPRGEGLSILDLGGVNQANVEFITGLGHRLHSENVLHAVDSFFGSSDPWETQTNPALIRDFLDSTFRFPGRRFDAVFIWDAFEFMVPQLLDATIERLLTALRPEAMMLAIFHSETRTPTVPLYRYRILENNLLRLNRVGERVPVQSFNSRSLEKMFSQCQSVKFFLTRDNLREVVVRR
jgi:hypothetical protein